MADLFAVKENLAGGALFHSGDLAHEGRFARPVIADHRHVFARMKDEIGIVQRLHAAIMLGQAARF